jgi:hypothetical protein
MLYSDPFPRYGQFAVQYAVVNTTDKQHTMSSHELESALMLMADFLKMYYTR